MAELNVRMSAVTAIKKIGERVLKAEFGTTCDMLQLDQELKSVEMHFGRFVQKHEVLVGAASGEELAAHDLLWEQVEAYYNKICVALRRKILERKNSSSTSSESSKLGGIRETEDALVKKPPSFDIKLDPVTIPVFDGSYTNWLAFKDVFETLVHKGEFPEAYKLSKLRQSVSAHVVPLIGGLYSGGYEEVWAALKARFDNQKLLAEIHVARFINIKVATDETSKALLAVVDTVQESLRALKVMKIPVDQWDALAVPIVVSKLPASTRREWCMSCDASKISALKDLLDFLERRAHSLSTEIIRVSQRTDTISPKTQHRNQQVVKSCLTSVESTKCNYCQGLHRVSRCQMLTTMKPDQRFEALKSFGLCFNCLKSGHNSKQCPSSGCRQCGRRHHTMFCRDTSVQPLNAQTVTSPTRDNQASASVAPGQPQTRQAFPAIAGVTRGNHTVLLATARAYVYGNTNEQRLARILCDPGSQVSFISDRLVNILNLHRSKCEMVVEGIGALAQTRSKGSVLLRLKSTYSEFHLNINALVIAAITSIIPSVHIDTKQWPYLAGLQLADPSFGTPGGIDILIGSDVWGLVVKRDFIRGKPDEPHAQRTQFGWVVFGPASTASSSTPAVRTLLGQAAEEDLSLEQLVRNFWKLEEVPGYSTRDEECDHLYAATHTRAKDGRYMVRLLFRNEPPQLGDSYRCALRQFYCLERRLAGDAALREKYVAFMREYVELGHMERVGRPSEHEGCYYIPHHAVTAKFRVVFNASARSANGVSLNDTQLVGPTIQDSLLNIIFRFRRYSIAITADVEKMFRQIRIAREHQRYQRILWRESPEELLGVYQLTTVTYGMASSPFNAVRTLQQCAFDNCGEVVDCTQAVAARDTIMTSFYVDDFLTSCNSISEAVVLARNVDKILSDGHFKLRKWNSNSSQVIQQITGETIPAAEHILDEKNASVLGLRWDPTNDELLFRIAVGEPSKAPTKRTVLSEVAQLFDPTGLLSPVVVTGKIFIQSLWSAGVTWDTPLPPELSEPWQRFRAGLHALSRFRVPRWLGMADGEVTSIHGFCDASSRAYAGVIYVKTVQSNGQARISLLTARTKVAPLNSATIPRLELSAAALLASMLQNVQTALGLQNTPYHLWSDSNIVLCWLRKHPTMLKPYVANRVRQIQELTSPDRWHHVRSAQNPADCASRGITADELMKHQLWFQGPEWLRGESFLPSNENLLNQQELSSVKEEEKVAVHSVVVTVAPEITTRRPDGKIIPLNERFSSLQSLLHTMTFILRWLPKHRQQRKLIVSADEQEEALQTLLRMHQRTVFLTDIKHLQADSNLPKSSRLLPLNPFLDPKGLLRVGGRITNASVPYDHRFPIILPKTGALTWLLIKDAHDRTLHGGTQLMLQTLRSRFWIFQARQAVRSYLHYCVVCRRHRGVTLTQQMAPLPGHRVTAARPFQASSVDYCGPFILRIGTKRSRSTVKTYMAIFVCMATKAVHIEVVEDLSSTAFLDAFTRFTSRRGPCHDLYSDNGTAFVGANRILQEDLAAWIGEQNQQSLANCGTRWHFITPSAPHQGGLWEAAVKSAKRHLMRLIGGQSLWYSQLQTLAARIEACLNSRPITPLSDDPEDKFALTPADFLIASPILATPEPTITDIPTSRLKHWQWLRQIHQHFWRRWCDEYLSTLQTRAKWQQRQEDIKVGDIVLVRHENLPPTHWRLGRVVEVHPGSDGLIRNATLKTQFGMRTRAVQKLCRLVDIGPNCPTGQDV